MDDRTNPRWKNRLAAALILVGITVFSEGIALETRNPRSGAEDDVALCALAAGVSMMAAGGSIPFARPQFVVLIAIASPYLAYGLVVSLIWVGIVLYGVARMIIGG